MADAIDKLKKIEFQALELTIQGYGAREIAQILDKGERTIERWRAKPDFKEALAQTKRQVRQKSIESVVDRLVKVQMLAIDAVEKILIDDKEGSRNKLTAAKLAGKWSGLESMELLLHSQLDRLQKHMSPHAYQELLVALSENSSTSPNGNGRGNDN